VILTYIEVEDVRWILLTSNVFPFDGSYVGRFFVNCTGKPLEILTKLKKLAGYDPDEEIELYEVGFCLLFYFYLLYNFITYLHLLLSLLSPLSLLVIVANKVHHIL
jgi:hypothetical protein